MPDELPPVIIGRAALRLRGGRPVLEITDPDGYRLTVGQDGRGRLQNPQGEVLRTFRQGDASASELSTSKEFAESLNHFNRDLSARAEGGSWWRNALHVTTMLTTGVEFEMRRGDLAGLASPSPPAAGRSEPAPAREERPSLQELGQRLRAEEPGLAARLQPEGRPNEAAVAPVSLDAAPDHGLNGLAQRRPSPHESFLA